MSAGLMPKVEADYTFAQDEPFRLDGGDSLRPVTLRCALYRKLNEARDNAILVCHALSGSARVGGVGAQSSATAGDSQRPGVAGRTLWTGRATNQGTGAGACHCHVFI